MFQDKAGRNLASFAQGKYVEYITGRPSPEAPPILESYRKGPSFLSTALQIGQAGLNRYNQYKGNMAGKDSPLLPPATPNNEIPQQPQNQLIPNEQSSSISAPVSTMEVPSYSAPVFGGDKSVLQGEMDDYFAQKAPTNNAATLGSSFQQTFV